MTVDIPGSDPCADDFALAGDLVRGARRVLQTYRVASEGTDPFSVRIPPDAVEELVLTITARVQHSVEQIVPFVPGSAMTNSFSRLMWQHVARRRDVRRYYLVPSSEDNRRRVEEQITEDKRHDVWSEPVPVTGDSVQAPMSPLWLIDGRIVVRQEPGSHGSGSWIVTGKRSEVDRAQTLIRDLRDRVTRSRGEENAAPDLTALLLTSAQMLHHVAQMSCAENRLIDDDGCAWYHGAWQFLRLFNMVSSPSWHSEFYAAQLRAAIHARGARRVLISGSADYTTLAFVLWAAHFAGGGRTAELDVHVVDLCRTPLLACRWYAERLGIKISIHQADITRKGEGKAQFDGGPPFDLVVADAFLTRFDISGAGRVLSRWFDLVRPGGSVITTVRLHPRNKYLGASGIDLDKVGDRLVGDPVDDFELRLRERAAKWQDMLPIDLETLSSLGRRYAKRMISNDLGDADAVGKTFEDHQFELMEVTAAPVRGELFGTEYLRVVARRPQRSLAGAVPD